MQLTFTSSPGENLAEGDQPRTTRRPTVRPITTLALLLTIGTSLAAPLQAVEATHQYYRFTQTKLRNDSAANSIQLSELQYKHLGSVVLVVDITNPDGNNPPAETPPLANDGDTGTKWLDFNRGPLVYDMGAPTTIDSYAFATANDAIERDPVSWRLEGSDDGVTWQILDQIADFATPTERFTFTDDFILPSTLPPAINSFVSFAPTIIQSRSTELSWNTTSATTVSIDQGIGAVAASGSSTVSPAATTTYTLTANSLGGTLTAQTTVTVVPSAPRSFQYFRFLPLALRTAAANSIQLAEFELLDTSGMPITGATVTNPGGDNPAGEVVENVIDGSVDTKWLDFLKGPLVFDFGAPVQVESYRLATANDASERDPVSWRLEGSSDGTAWETVHLVTRFMTPSGRKTFTYDLPLPVGGYPPLVPGPVTYQFFRFAQTKLRDDATSDSIQLSEFNFSNGGSDVGGATATNPGGRNPPNETPPLVVDGDTATKWLDFNKGPLVLDFGTPVTVDAYTFTTANDAVERDPVSWALEGSVDGINWRLIDSQEDYLTPDGRFTMTDPIPTLAPGLSFPAFAITTVTRNNGTQEVSLTWQSVPAAHYNVQRSTSLGAAAWTSIVTGITSQGATTTSTLTSQTATTAFYRVVRID